MPVESSSLRLRQSRTGYKFISKNDFMHCRTWSTKFLSAGFDQTKYLNQNITKLLIWCFLINLRKINDKIVFIYGKRMGELKRLTAIQISKPVFSRNIHKPKYFLSKKYPGKRCQLSSSCPLHKTLYKEHHVKGNSLGVWCEMKYMLWPQNDPHMSHCLLFHRFFLIIAFIRWYCSNNSPVLSHVLPKKSVFIFCKSADKLFP